MITREQIVDEIQKFPDKDLDHLYRMIKELKSCHKGGESIHDGIFAKLRTIKITAEPNFSMQANLYNVEGENPE